MSLVHKLERRYGRFAIPNLTFIIMIGQVAVWGFTKLGNLDVIKLVLIPSLVLEGEVWRLLTFLIVPPLTWHPIFLVFFWMFLYSMGTALEERWQAFRYNLFWLTGWLFTVGLSFIAPTAAYLNLFLVFNVILAVAVLYPDEEIQLMLFIPMRMRWLGVLKIFIYLVYLVSYPLPYKLSVVAALAAVGLFIHRDLRQQLSAFQRRKEYEQKREEVQEEAFHTCSECGVTDKTHPDREFRFRGDRELCEICLKLEDKRLESGRDQEDLPSSSSGGR